MQMKIPEDLSNIKSNFIGPFSLRQILCLGVAVPLVFIVIKYLTPYVGIDICIFLCMLVAMPALAIGFCPREYLQNLYFEQFLGMIINYNVIRPIHRKYKIKNEYKYIFDQYDKEQKEKQQKDIKNLTRTERKKRKQFNRSIKGVF